MINKLKWKFVLILMLVVSILICTVFSAIYHVADQVASRAAVEVLRQSLTGAGASSPLFGPQGYDIPHFAVSISRDGYVAPISGNVSIEDDLLLEVCAASLAQTADQGVLEDYGLRYMRVSYALETRVAFANMSYENSIIHGLTQGLVVLGATALLLFFGLSVFLSSLAVRPIREAWDKQRQFVADASHELNTPLTVISSNLELLGESGSLDRDSRNRLERVQAESDRIKLLTGELLSLARAENDSRKAVRSRVEMSGLVMREALLFEPLFFESDLGFEYRIEQDVSMPGDEGQLTQLVAILLDNARKYAAAGTTVTLELTRLGRRSAMLWIRNYGDPIPPDRLKNIFERFYRVDDSREANGGYGLGLAIARTLAQSNRCTLRAASSAQDGTIFTLNLPTVAVSAT